MQKIVMRGETLELNVDRFWSKVRKTDTCWEWQAGICGSGYGGFSVKTKDGNKNRHTHVVSWILTNGDVPAGMCVLHTCDNRKCVNPDHLFLGSRLNNVQDMDKKGRRKTKASNGSTNGFSKLNEESVRLIRERFQRGELQSALAKEFNVTQVCISQITLRKTWRHVV